MTNKKYMKLLFAIDEYFEKEKLIITWPNGLIVKCNSFSGLMETDIEPGEEGFIGEYTIAVNEVEIIREGNDNSVEIFNNAIEISLKCIPNVISLEDGTVIWTNDED